MSSSGFESVKAGFNTLGYAIGSKPASIKNYRDEFDPYFPNTRKGWHKRPLKPYCKRVLDAFVGTTFLNFTELIKSFLIKDYFHLTSELKYYCVEAKGLNGNSASIAMTEKEFLMAQNLQSNYCLFIVPISQTYLLTSIFLIR